MQSLRSFYAHRAAPHDHREKVAEIVASSGLFVQTTDLDMELVNELVFGVSRGT